MVLRSARLMPPILFSSLLSIHWSQEIFHVQTGQLEHVGWLPLLYKSQNATGREISRLAWKPASDSSSALQVWITDWSPWAQNSRNGFWKLEHYSLFYELFLVHEGHNLEYYLQRYAILLPTSILGLHGVLLAGAQLIKIWKPGVIDFNKDSKFSRKFWGFSLTLGNALNIPLVPSVFDHRVKIPRGGSPETLGGFIGRGNCFVVSSEWKQFW